jgi:hypothetical protein
MQPQQGWIDRIGQGGMVRGYLGEWSANIYLRRDRSADGQAKEVPDFRQHNHHESHQGNALSGD